MPERAERRDVLTMHAAHQTSMQSSVFFQARTQNADCASMSVLMRAVLTVREKTIDHLNRAFLVRFPRPSASSSAFIPEGIQGVRVERLEARRGEVIYEVGRSSRPSLPKVGSFLSSTLT